MFFNKILNVEKLEWFEWPPELFKQSNVFKFFVDSDSDNPTIEFKISDDP